MASGEAAGAAAALCVAGELLDVHALKVDDLRRVLREHAVILEGTY